MFNLAKQEKLIIVFLSSTALIGLAVDYYKKTTHQIELKVVPSEISKQEKNIDGLIKEEKEVNINSANTETLMRLPGIGPKLAQAIVDFRSRSGAFGSTEDIQKVAGIGPKKFEQIKEFLVIK